MTRAAIENWLARLSDPRGLNAAWPAEAIAADDARTVDRLLFEAERHSVQPVLFGHLLGLLRHDPDAFILGTGKQRGERALALIQSVNEKRLQETAQVMVLAEVAREVRSAMAGLPVALVKGLDFAEQIFGGIQYRSFADIDLLLHPSVEPDLRDILMRQGFNEHQPKADDVGYTERQWLKPHPQVGYILVELHTDLVHTKRLRERISLDYERYAGERSGGVTPAARLILAAVHAATSHLFGRLQYVVDGMMAARVGVDGKELGQRAVETGAVLPLRTMLRLATEIFGAEECRELLGSLP